MSAIADAFLLRAPADVSRWAAHFDAHEIPVRAATAEALEELRAIEDDVDARMLAEAIAADPLMTLKVLRHASSQRSPRRAGDAETVTEALVMIGITPFFRSFGPQPTIEERLATQPEALQGLQRVMLRGQRAARFALGFAVHRMDHDAAVIHEAALLHDFAELLLWVHAPALALGIAQRQQDNPNLRSGAAQREALNVELAGLQQHLMKQWRLPELLVKISDDQSSRQHQVRNVQLAIRVARHTTQGWDNPALPDDVSDIAALLNMATGPTLELLHDLDDED